MDLGQPENPVVPLDTHDQRAPVPAVAAGDGSHLTPGGGRDSSMPAEPSQAPTPATIAATELMIPPPIRGTDTSPKAPADATPLIKGPSLWLIGALVVIAVVAWLITAHHTSSAAHLGARAGTTTTVPTTTSTSTTTTTTVAIPVAPQPAANTAATALVSSWAAGDRARALTVATTPAVTTLFAVPYPGGNAIARGCSAGSPTVVCTFGPPGGGNPNLPIYSLTLAQAPSGGWYVSAVKIG